MLEAIIYKQTKLFRRRQGSNLRGQCPLDFKSNALTTRPRLLHVGCHQKHNLNQNSLPLGLKKCSNLAK